MDRATIQSQIDAAGPAGHLVVTFRDYLVPQLDEAGEAVRALIPKETDGVVETDAGGNPVMVPEGAVIHAHDPLGHIRTVSGFPVVLLDTHIGIGAGPGQPILNLIPFSDIDRVHADAGELSPGALSPPVVEPVPAETPPVVTPAEPAAPTA